MNKDTTIALIDFSRVDWTDISQVAAICDLINETPSPRPTPSRQRQLPASHKNNVVIRWGTEPPPARGGESGQQRPRPSYNIITEPRALQLGAPVVYRTLKVGMRVELTLSGSIRSHRSALLAGPNLLAGPRLQETGTIRSILNHPGSRAKDYIRIALDGLLAGPASPSAGLVGVHHVHIARILP